VGVFFCVNSIAGGGRCSLDDAIAKKATSNTLNLKRMIVLITMINSYHLSYDGNIVGLYFMILQAVVGSAEPFLQ
jgi:hypothetical protein